MSTVPITRFQTATATRTAVGPVDPEARLTEADIVRGFALFGVLLVNMYGFGADWPAWTGTADRLAYTAMHLFFESKSWTLISLLFGFGFALQIERAEARSAGFLPAYLRRLGALFALGAAHALLFDGDILMLLAELGLALLLVRRLPTRALLVLAVALLAVFPAARFVSRQGPDRIENPRHAQRDLVKAQREDVYAIGSLAEVVADNATTIPADPRADIATPESSLAVFALFLVGLAVGRSSLLRDIPAHRTAFRRLRAWGLGIGLAAAGVELALTQLFGYEVFRPSRAAPAVQLLGDLTFVFGTIALAFGYASLLVLAAQTERGRKALAPLAAVGRLALSVYLLQTLLFTTLFYGYGFGQVFRLGPVAVTGWTAVFFAAQVIACQWWAKRFRYGPAEWLWRSVTYLRWQPMRLPAAETA